jgi:8-oxo-dGTP pyrophosphatase MutT (NUDIX family)
MRRRRNAARRAIREAREELGIEVEIVGDYAPISHDYAVRRVTLHPFSCRIVSGEPQPLAVRTALARAARAAHR